MKSFFQKKENIIISVSVLVVSGVLAWGIISLFKTSAYRGDYGGGALYSEENYLPDTESPDAYLPDGVGEDVESAEPREAN